MVEGSGHHTPKPKMGLNEKIKISNTEIDALTERRFVILWPTKDQSKSPGNFRIFFHDNDVCVISASMSASRGLRLVKCSS